MKTGAVLGCLHHPGGSRVNQWENGNFYSCPTEPQVDVGVTSVNCSFCLGIFVTLCPWLWMFGQRLVGLQFYDIMTQVLHPMLYLVSAEQNTN